MAEVFRIPEAVAMAAGDLGSEGLDWLASLPATIHRLGRSWRLELGEPFLPGGATAWVGPVTRSDGSPAVLKIAIPEEETRDEAEALRLYGGRRAVRLLEHDPESNALLLERLEPGRPLLELPEDEAHGHAVQVLTTLWRPVPTGHPFRLATDLARRWAGEVPEENEALRNPVEAALIEEASRLLAELAEDGPEALLLHQDFHHGNILSSGRGWVAIDPKPVVGERAFDASALLRDRRHEVEADSDPEGRVSRRFERIVADLRVDPQRLRAWGVGMGVELGLWSIGAGDLEGGRGDLMMTRLIAGL